MNIYTGASLIDGSVKGQYARLVYFKKEGTDMFQHQHTMTNADGSEEHESETTLIESKLKQAQQFCGL